MQQLLKPASGFAWACVVAAELLCELLIAVKDAIAALHVRLGWETAPAFAFVEAPSWMLEYLRDPAISKRISSNVTTGTPMPDDLIAKMRATRLIDQFALS
jgi:hypothetical protein